MNLRKIVILWISVNLGLCLASIEQMDAPHKCGYAACDSGKPDMLNVHLVPHGHCDTGWIKTVDQYYYGSANSIQNVGIQYNLDSIVQALTFNKDRRFTWIEVGYFWRWWGEQDSEMKARVIQLVNEGRLMFGNNGWEMNDEASTYYQEIIDQHTIGEKFLMDTFGTCGRPLTAWQIDTFGHSREMASLLAQMGHDSLYFARLDYQDKAKRIKTKSMEMIWQGSDDMGPQSDLFTGVLYNHYSPPPHFCYSCGDDPIMDDPRLFDYNVDSMIDLFIKEALQWASAFRTNHILLPMGIDFDYELANRWYKNEDKIIKHVNARQAKGSKINVLYSTVPCYTYAVHASNHTFPTKSDDFFPYSSQPHTFWTGSFTSRPTLKGYVRDTNSFLQTVKQLSVLSGLSDKADVDAKIDFLRRGLAIDVNHGQLPGTGKQAVAYDNYLRLSNGSIEAMKVVEAAYSKLFGDSVSRIFHCTLLNISECSVTDESSEFSVTVYNSLSRPVLHWTRIPVMSEKLNITDGRNIPLTVQIIPVAERTKEIPERSSKALYNAVFPAYLPPMGYNTFIFKMAPPALSLMDVMERTYSTATRAGSLFTVENEHLRLTYNGQTNQLVSITNIMTGEVTEAQIDLRYYTGFVGGKQSSGAYIFRPNELNPVTFPTLNIRVIRGPLVQEVHQHFADWATLITRLYRNSNYVEIEWTVGPIPYNGKVGKEVVVHYQTSLETNTTCYTDSNGRQTMERVLNYRKTWNFSNAEPVAGNYNPLNSFIFIQDKRKGQQVSVLVDRSQGGAHLRKGAIEVMVHRRLMVDDGLGMEEPLNEPGRDGKGLIVRGKHYLTFNSTKSSPRQIRELAQRVQIRPTVTASNTTKPSGTTIWSALKRPLPPNVHILTLEGWRDSQVLMRLEHTFQTGEDSIYSQPVTIDLRDLFVAMEITAVTELSLAGALPKSEMTRMKWRKDKGENHTLKFKPSSDPFNVVLHPMEIKTFALKVTHK